MVWQENVASAEIQENGSVHNSAQYDELDKYPVMPPHAFARVVRDKATLNIIYQIIEPPMTKKEEQYREEIMDIFIRSLTANIDEIDANPEAYTQNCDG